MEPMSKIVKDHLGHNLKATVEEGLLVLECTDCNCALIDEHFEPEACLVSVITMDNINNVLMEMDLSSDDHDKVMNAITPATIEQIRDNIWDYAWAESFTEALKTELGYIIEDHVEGYVAEPNEE